MIPKRLIFSAICIAVAALLWIAGVLWDRWGTRIKRRIDDNRPVQCVDCGQWVRNVNTRWTMHTAAGWVQACDKCYDELHSWHGRGHGHE